MLTIVELQPILEAILLGSAKPMTIANLLAVFEPETAPSAAILQQTLAAIKDSCADRGFTLVEVASGYQLQVKPEYALWVAKLWEEKPARYSRAFFETLAIIAYRQPVTKGEIEEIRGVGISTSIFRMLDERDWIRVVGHKNVPGKPTLYATTKNFLDYFGLKSLEELPSLPEIMQLGQGKNLELELNFAQEAAIHVNALETRELVENQAIATAETTETTVATTAIESESESEVEVESEAAATVATSETVIESELLETEEYYA